MSRQFNPTTNHGLGDTDISDDGNDSDAPLAIVANNTLRLRIVPCEPDHLG